MQLRFTVRQQRTLLSAIELLRRFGREGPQPERDSSKPMKGIGGRKRAGDALQGVVSPTTAGQRGLAARPAGKNSQIVSFVDAHHPRPPDSIWSDSKHVIYFYSATELVGRNGGWAARLGPRL